MNPTSSSTSEERSEGTESTMLRSNVADNQPNKGAESTTSPNVSEEKRGEGMKKRQRSDEGRNEGGVARQRLDDDKKKSTTKSDTTEQQSSEGEARGGQAEGSEEARPPAGQQEKAQIAQLLQQQLDQQQQGGPGNPLVASNPGLMRDPMSAGAYLPDPSQQAGMAAFNPHQAALFMGGFPNQAQLPMGPPYGAPSHFALGGNQQEQQQQQDGSMQDAMAMAARSGQAGMPFAGVPTATLQQFLMQQQGGAGMGDMGDAARMAMMGFPGMAAPPAYGFSGLPGSLAGFYGSAMARPPPMFGMPPPSKSTAISLSSMNDDDQLSEYQILVRKQLEIFEAQQEDVESNTQGRKKQVVLGQVGLRCRHCAGLPLRQRGRGAVYYPTKLQGIYQAAQNMASSHLREACQVIDEGLKAQINILRERRDTASGGKQYWADGARALGIYEAEDGLRLSHDGNNNNNNNANQQEQQQQQDRPEQDQQEQPPPQQQEQGRQQQGV